MSKGCSILVVDDEKNIRMTLVHALEVTGYHVESAMTGEEALLMLKASGFDLMFLDLMLPGMGGIEVLRKARAHWPAMRVVVITAHGTVDNAVEAMKSGAADFLQKPFTPAEIRELTKSVLAPIPHEEEEGGYDGCVARARSAIEQRQLSSALTFIRRAMALDPTRPAAFNLLGAAEHLAGQRYRAQNCFRAALALDPTYKPALENLERSASGGISGMYMELSLGSNKGTAPSWG